MKILHLFAKFIAEGTINERINEGFASDSLGNATKNCTKSSVNFSFPKSTRILKRKHFKEIASSHKRYSGQALVIDYRPSKETKLGITVVRQFGNAPMRNLFKRRVREAFRTKRSLLIPCEMIVMPKRGVTDISLEMIAKDLLEYNNVSQCSATKSS